MPNQDNREGVDIKDVGPKETSHGGYYLTNVRVDFDKGDNVADYKPVRAGLILTSPSGQGTTRNGIDENPNEKGQTKTTGQSRFVTDTPGLSTPGTRASLQGNALQVIFVAGEYNKKSKSLSSNVFFYAVQVVLGKDGKIDKSQTKAIPLTRTQFINYAKQYKIKYPEFHKRVFSNGK